MQHFIPKSVPPEPEDLDEFGLRPDAAGVPFWKGQVSIADSIS